MADVPAGLHGLKSPAAGRGDARRGSELSAQASGAEANVRVIQRASPENSDSAGLTDSSDVS